MLFVAMQCNAISRVRELYAGTLRIFVGGCGREGERGGEERKGKGRGGGEGEGGRGKGGEGEREKGERGRREERERGRGGEGERGRGKELIACLLVC